MTYPEIIVLPALGVISALLVSYNVAAARQGELIGYLFAGIWVLMFLCCSCELVWHAYAVD